MANNERLNARDGFYYNNLAKSRHRRIPSAFLALMVSGKRRSESKSRQKRLQDSFRRVTESCGFHFTVRRCSTQRKVSVKGAD